MSTTRAPHTHSTTQQRHARLSRLKRPPHRHLPRPLLLMLLLLLPLPFWGCPHRGQQPTSRLFPAPRKLPFYRHLKTGASPTTVRQTICKHWSLSPCQKAQFGPLQQNNQGTHFTFTGPVQAFPCRHQFFFHDQGLHSVTLRCKVHFPAQSKALVRRYRRWLGKAKRQQHDTHFARYIWGSWTTKLRHSLTIHHNKIYATHRDLRTVWRQTMKRIQPSKQSSKTHTWRRWKAVAPAVKREVLTNLSRILHVWLRHLQRQKLEVIRPSSDWAPPRLQSGCERLTPTPQAWTRDPWQQLAFQPTHPLRLHYRLTFQAPDWSRYSKRYLRRFSTSMRRRIRSFQLEAIGCGLRFLLDGSQNERILHFSRIQVLPIPTQ